jgi:CHAD domain-containing protein
LSTGKWISDLSAEVPLADAARRVLGVRLEVVREYLRLALHEADKDPEYVHQLRVGTRRATAALDIFALCLPEKVYRSARKQLRRLRRAAGAARDWDVFLETLLRPPCKTSGRARPGNDFLIGLAFGQRAAAQAQLQEANPDFPFAFERLTADVLHAIHRPGGGMSTLLDLARPVLKNLLQELDRAAGRDLDDYANLHQVRIAGKRLRYAMEVFAPCFGEEFRERHYAAVEEMQDILGLANDSHVAAGRLGGILDRLKATLPGVWKRYRGGIDALTRHHEERLPEERGRFLKWWERWQESGGEKALASLVGPEEQASA